MSEANKDLGLVTAYGYAVIGGYEGTPEEFCEDLAAVKDGATIATQKAAEAAASAVIANEAATRDVPTAVDAWLSENVDPETGYVLDRTLSMSNAAAPADLVGDLKSSINTIDKAITGKKSFNWAETSVVGANRKWYYCQLKKDEEYTIDVAINNIPSKGPSTHFQLTSVTAYNSSPSSVILDRLTEARIYSSGENLTFKYMPTANVMGLYLYISAADVAEIDIGITVTQNIFCAESDEYSNYIGSNYTTIAYAKKLSSSAYDSCSYAFNMKAGETYHFRILLDLKNIELNKNAGTIYAFAADKSGTSIHNIIVRGSYKISENDTTGLNKWHYFDYTAEADTDFVYSLIQNCDAESQIILQCALNNYPVVSQDTFITEGLNGRCIFDSKPYLFKQIGSFSGTGQSIAQTGNILYLALGGHTSDGKIQKYINNIYVEEKTTEELEHPFNVTIMKNGNLLIANIVGYGEETESRHVYEYNYDSNTILNTYTPVVEGKLLVFADQIDDTTLLLGFKDSDKTAYITCWYSYDITSGTITQISSTTRDRVYAQGGCLRGNIVYMAENNKASGGLTNPPQILSINYKTGEILNKITCYGFGETEGCYISKDQGSGIYAYFLENSTRIWCLKLS